MMKILTLGLDGKRLSQVNELLRAKGHAVRGADCGSGMRHLLSMEAFHYIVLLDPLPSGFSEALRHELRAGRMSPRVMNLQGMSPDDAVEMITTETSRRAAA